MLVSTATAALALEAPTSHASLRAELRIALPCGGWCDVPFFLYTTRERRWTTTLENNFDGIGIAASSCSALADALGAAGLWSHDNYKGILTFVRAEAWALVQPLVSGWRAAELAARPPCIRSGC